MTELEFNKFNSRRGDLITKKFTTGLTNIETKELATLQKKCSDYVDTKYPIDLTPLKELAERFNVLRKKVETRIKEIEAQRKKRRAIPM